MTDISKLWTHWATREKQPNRTALAVSALFVLTVATVTVSVLPDRRQNESNSRKAASAGLFLFQAGETFCTVIGVLMPAASP
jgi:hypothetical protein